MGCIGSGSSNSHAAVGAKSADGLRIVLWRLRLMKEPVAPPPAHYLSSRNDSSNIMKGLRCVILGQIQGVSELCLKQEPEDTRYVSRALQLNGDTEAERMSNKLHVHSDGRTLKL